METSVVDNPLGVWAVMVAVVSVVGFTWMTVYSFKEEPPISREENS